MKYLAWLFVRIGSRSRREPDAVRIFTTSRVNGGRYVDGGDYYGRWTWPTGTWLQERIKHHAKKND